MKAYDALVIGGGPAGASAARLLAGAGWSVALVEKAGFPRRKVCGEFISATSLPWLRRLGVAESFLAQAGPEIRQVGLYAGAATLAAEMPCPVLTGAEPEPETQRYGRALGREHLDALLLAAAARAGAELWQPWAMTGIERRNHDFECTAVASGTRETARLSARIVIAAHGSWERGSLPTQAPPPPARASDLFAFKAHFRHGDVPQALMPLLAFPGGYGGLVNTDRGRTSLSCCIRRDTLAGCRARWPRLKAAEAVFMHLRGACRGVDLVLASATLEGAWLSAGPIRPGLRMFHQEGLFAIGNAAGEAHPIVAEGISMAIQSAVLLCERLIAQRDAVFAGPGRAAVGRAYATAWRRHFAHRVYAAAVFAQLAMRPLATGLAVALLERAPSLLTAGAGWAGKARSLGDARIAGAA